MIHARFCRLMFLWMVVSTAVAQAGAPRLNALVPHGGQRGTTLEVEFQGYLLDDPQEIIAYTPGIQVESMEPVVEMQVNGRPQPVASGTRLRVRLNIAADCPLGQLGLRLRTLGGMSDYRRFFVSPFPLVEENESSQDRNDEPLKAKPISGSASIFGTLRESADVDYYSFEMRQGQRLSAEVVAARLGVERGLPDLHLSILDAAGEILVAADDSALYLQDPVVATQIPRDGTYLIAVRHALYNGNNEAYLLHAGTFVRPTALYPAGGKAGDALPVRLLGDPLGVATVEARLPVEYVTGLERRTVTPVDYGFDYAWSFDDPLTQQPAPTPNTLRVVPFPNVLEVEPNDSAAEVSESAAVELPIAFNGILEQPGDVDVFRFRATANQTFRVHALANALGSPVDPMIWIRRVDGKGPVVRGNDSRLSQHGLPQINGVNRNTLDVILQFTAASDGEYLLGVEDERRTGGADHVYRIECQREHSATYTYIPQEPENRYTPQSRQAINVPAGGRYNTSFSVLHTDRVFEGDLELIAVGLPPGVTMDAPRITPEMTRVPVVFTAARSCAPQGTFIDVLVRPVSADTSESSQLFASGVRQNLPMNLSGNQDYYLHIPLDKVAFAVTQPADFDLEVTAPRSALVQNGEMALKFKVHRRPGFEEPVAVTMEWKPNGVTTATPITIPANVSEGEYLISAARNATAGKYPVTLTAVNGNYQPRYGDRSNRVYVCAEPFELNIAEPHFDAKFPRFSVERGKSAPLVVKLQQLKPFTGTAKISLARLPRGIQTKEPFLEVSAADKEVTFTLLANADSLVGNYKGLTLDVSVDEQGQIVRQFTGSGTLRVDAERGIQANR